MLGKRTGLRKFTFCPFRFKYHTLKIEAWSLKMLHPTAECCLSEHRHF